MNYLVCALTCILLSCDSKNNRISSEIQKTEPVNPLSRNSTAALANNEVIVISKIKDRSYSYFISNSIGKIESFLDESEKYKHYDRDFLQKIVVSEGSVRFLLDYLKSNDCINYSDTGSYIYTSYIIDSYDSDGKGKVCLYLLPKDIIDYYSKMKIHLDQSKYKTEFRGLNKLFDQFISIAEKESK